MTTYRKTDNVLETNWPMFSAEQRKTRVDLAACHRLADLNGFSDIVWNHISARVPSQPDQFLINLFGLRFDEVTASNLVTLDKQGSVVVPPQDKNGKVIETRDMNFTGFVIHSAIYEHRPDINCVMHAHPRYGSAVSALDEGFVPMIQDAFQFYGKVAYHEYEGLSLDLDERERLAASLGDKPVMVMRNHGLMTTGSTVAEAYMRMHYLELSCRVQIEVMSSGQSVRLPPKEVCEKAAKQYAISAPAGTHEWEPLLRMLDTTDSSYRN